MNLEELFLKRQSTREFSEREVADEDLKEIAALQRLLPPPLTNSRITYMQ